MTKGCRSKTTMWTDTGKWEDTRYCKFERNLMPRRWLNQCKNWLFILLKLRRKVQISITACYLLEKIYLKRHVARNILLSRLLVCRSRPLHSYLEKKKNSVALVRERTISTERPPPVGEVSANFCG